MSSPSGFRDVPGDDPPRAQRSVDLTTYLDQSVYPPLFDRLPEAFPEFQWEQRQDHWVAGHWPVDFPYQASDPRPDRLCVYRDRPYWIKIHGQSGVRLLDLVNGGEKPYGPAFMDAVQALCERAGVALPAVERSEEALRAARAREARRSILECVTALAEETLWSAAGAASRAYLHDRGLSDDDIRHFRLGLYPDERQVGVRLTVENHGLAEARELAVPWAKMVGYVVIPWADASGQLLTLYGRWPSPTLPEGMPKTIALPGEGTKASPFCYDRARRAGHKDLVLVEGVLDALVLQAQGDTRVIACVGAQLSTKQVATLVGQRIRSVTICLDPDAGGDRGVVSCLRNLDAGGIQARVAPRLPDGLDPDQFVLRDGIEAWRAHIEQAASGPLFRARQALGDIQPGASEVDRRAAVERVLEYEATLRGPAASLAREDILHLTADRTGYSFGALTDVAEEHAARRKGEERERALDNLLREAQATRSASDADQIIHALQGKLARLASAVPDVPPPFSVDRLERESQLVPDGKPSGWEALDRLEVRFNPGELALAAARTGHGKTTFLVGLGLNWLAPLTSGGDDALIVVYSLEEPEVRLYHRLLATLTARDVPAGEGWSVTEVRDFLRSPSSRGTMFEWRTPALLDDARAWLRAREDALRIVYRPSWTVADIEAHARELAERQSVGGILIDYLQRIPPPPGNSFERRDIEVSSTARRLKQLAVDLDVPVVVGAQINRQAVTEAGKIPNDAYTSDKLQDALRTRRPRLHHLREGGSEQEADLVLGLLNYRADFDTNAGEDPAQPPSPGFPQATPPPPITRLEIGVLKSRYGAVGGWGALAFEGRTGLLRDPNHATEI
jgi:DNA primase